MNDQNPVNDQIYVVATPKPWSLCAFARVRATLPGRWLIVTDPADLHAALLQNPRYVFFPHWSHIVPAEVVQQHECVCFHMTDVPYGRGGSPLQNLIARGHRETRVTALRMSEVLDGGPVYAKRPLTLDGTAEAIFERASILIYDMIGWIVANEPVPEAQQGEATVFPRRKPFESALPRVIDQRGLYDHIRMLDAPGYPKAFVDIPGWRLEFDAAEIDDDGLVAHVRFTAREEDRS